MISVGNIGELISAFSAAAFVFYLLVFIALIIMRVTHPNEPRPFKVLDLPSVLNKLCLNVDVC